MLRNQRRLLNVIIPLDIKSITIIPPDTIQVKTEMYDDIDFENSEIQINFPGGSVIAENGVPYSSTTDSFALDDP